MHDSLRTLSTLSSKKLEILQFGLPENAFTDEMINEGVVESLDQTLEDLHDRIGRKPLGLRLFVDSPYVRLSTPHILPRFGKREGITIWA